MKKLVIFDLDGTLVNTSYDICDNVNLTLKRFGYNEITLEETVRFVGNGARKLIERALKGESPSNFEEILAYYNLKYNYCSSPKTYVYDGIYDLLGKLKKSGYKSVILSNKPLDGVREVCKKFFCNGEFDACYGQVDGVEIKPSAESVKRVLTDMGISASETVMVGDGETDVKTALAAKVDGIAVLWGYRDKETLLKAGATTFANTCDEVFEKIVSFDKTN